MLSRGSGSGEEGTDAKDIVKEVWEGRVTGWSESHRSNQRRQSQANLLGTVARTQKGSVVGVGEKAAGGSGFIMASSKEKVFEPLAKQARRWARAGAEELCTSSVLSDPLQE